MTMKERACALRARGRSISGISKELGINLSYAYRSVGDMARGPLLPTSRTVVREFTQLAAGSTRCERISVSLPRINALHGAVA